MPQILVLCPFENSVPDKATGSKSPRLFARLYFVSWFQVPQLAPVLLMGVQTVASAHPPEYKPFPKDRSNSLPIFGEGNVKVILHH